MTTRPGRLVWYASFGSRRRERFRMHHDAVMIGRLLDASWCRLADVLVVASRRPTTPEIGSPSRRATAGSAAPAFGRRSQRTHSRLRRSCSRSCRRCLPRRCACSPAAARARFSVPRSSSAALNEARLGSAIVTRCAPRRLQQCSSRFRACGAPPPPPPTRVAAPAWQPPPAYYAPPARASSIASGKWSSRRRRAAARPSSSPSRS